MATNGKSGDNRRHGAVKNRSQVKNPKTNQWVKRDAETERCYKRKVIILKW